MICTIGILNMYADDALGAAGLALQYHKGRCTCTCIPILAIELGKASFAVKRPYNQNTFALAHKAGVRFRSKLISRCSAGALAKPLFPTGHLCAKPRLPPGWLGSAWSSKLA